MTCSLEPNAEPLPGYRLVQRLGRGGVGEVWQAEAPGFVAKAIKFIPTENSEAVLTQRELDGLAKIRQIRHPYLLSIDRYESIEGYIVIVMELADKSLADRFDECAQRYGTGIPRDELLRYMREAAEVLDVLSMEHGLQHLDVKPENLFLMSGHVKVADFGLVQPSMIELQQSALAFTPAYAPPELFHGKVVPSADQYSLAVTYQELLTGRRPFLATSFRELIFQHEGNEPDVGSLPPCDQLVLRKALNKNVEQRFTSCSAMVDSLTIGIPSDATSKVDGSVARPQMNPTQIVSTKSHPAKAARPFVLRTPTGVPGRPASAITPVDGLVRPAPPKSVASLPALIQANRETVSSVELRPKQDKVTSTFLACIPLPIYARKLRAFMDVMQAELEGAASAEETVLRFRPHVKGWFARRTSGSSLFLKLETVSPPDRPDSSVVQATVYSSDPSIAGSELTRRGVLLIRCLRSFLMASDSRASINAEALRAELWREHIKAR